MRREPRPLTVPLPAGAMVVLVGVAGSGKSTLAARHFAPSEVLSSDAFRAIVSGDEADQGASDEAFARLHGALDERLRRGLLTVVDATNVEDWARRQLLAIAARHARPSVAVILDLPLALCIGRASHSRVRRVPPAVVRRQHARLARSRIGLEGEGFARLVVANDPAAVDALTFVRVEAGGGRPGNGTSRRNRAQPDDARSSNRHRNA